MNSLVKMRMCVAPPQRRQLLHACYKALPHFTNQGLATMLWAVARWGAAVVHGCEQR